MIDAGAMRDLYGRVTKLEQALERRRVETFGAPILRLDYTLASDPFNNAAWTAGTFFDLIGAQNFTVGSSSSLFAFFLTLGIVWTTAAGVATVVTVRFNLSNSIVRQLGSSSDQVNSVPFCFACDGTWWATGLGVGTQTIRAQLYASAASNVYLRASSAPIEEYLNIQVIEFPR